MLASIYNSQSICTVTVNFNLVMKATSPMGLGWRSSFRAAMSEQDSAKRAAACERARHEINSRLLELAGQASDDAGAEPAELEEALRQITMHEWSKDK
jgi:hypothetical protein